MPREIMKTSAIGAVKKENETERKREREKERESFPRKLTHRTGGIERGKQEKDTVGEAAVTATRPDKIGRIEAMEDRHPLDTYHLFLMTTRHA
ncbi:hypothetical protein HPP92_018760 [Vanilla planifolia]|uniref:Uncharacterized protein n=1 Tax=Vanilla planifolia TaxID=51239 RepID=A0A835UL15_VANPL|nr:hypothetical protein HPP92_019340 [Vanilla planifolia]KAG0464596.1 hypothetical protein HPP92_018760 [Vanilla planifolia]